MIKVLMYHRIVEDEIVSRISDLCLHKEDFRRHLKLLERFGFTPITLNDYSLSLGGELTLPKKPIILTFDDGYRDTYEIAFPLLQEFGMKAVIFVLGDRSININRWDAENGMPAATLMDARQIVEMHSAGLEIGSHSMTHARLTEIPQDRLWEEIQRSRMVLEILLNAPVQSFSYPYGLVNDIVEQVVIDAGYSFGCGVYSGPPIFGARPYQIRRLEIGNSTGGVGFMTRILTPYPHYAWCRWKAGSLVRTRFGRRGHTPAMEISNNQQPI